MNQFAPYTVDIDALPVTGKGYTASFVIGRVNGEVLCKRTLPELLPSYSQALAHAYTVARAAVDAFREEDVGRLGQDVIAAALVAAIPMSRR
ncbi:hypothetical protein L2Y96_12360 [Luteibacter aegosomaticola]|uniref:hypothetical protein n=1 Tax=Luteibacter aegosomaticola TaxID=2911538 RepID=UPI001FFBE39B|nr:hypothetical protein [Luteibacter aegosomaticola]UPG88212.1 hypothetical protein L2Y96_12360 [Luteibacter aegosomaticola]